MRDFPKFWDHFFYATLGTSLAAGSPWKITDTSASGTPTYAPVSPSACGEVALTLASTNEVENVCLDFGNVLAFDIDNMKRFETVVKISAITAGTTIAFGMQSARNDDTDATANNAQFKLVGSTAVVLETDDGTTDTDDVASGQALSTAFRRFAIDFSNKADVKFFIDGRRVASGTTFSMAAATGSLQPFFQIQKTATTAVDSLVIDYVEVKAKRVA